MVTAPCPECKIMATSRSDKKNGISLSFIVVDLYRATSALRLKFEVCKELKNHLELLPKTAYIQAESQFSAQLKFLPR